MILLWLTDHQETLYVAIIAAVSSIATAYLSRQNGKKANDIHQIVERRKNAQAPIHGGGREDDPPAPPEPPHA